MSRSASEVFVESLLPECLGYPLWIPEPHSNLPAEYKETGDRPGDLVVLTKDGVRDYQFNIFAEGNNPINVNRVPPGFKPMSANEQDDVLVPEYHKPSTQISTFDVKKVSSSGDVSAIIPGTPADAGAGFEFRTTRSSGAALVLPVGASRVDHMNLQRIQEYIEANAKGWFEYVNGVRGRQTRHLYLVTGCDKTSDWGVTSFSSQSRSQEVCLKFTAGLASVAASYSWSASSNTPSAFRSSKPSLNKVENQCVFIRGFTITQKTPRPFSKSTGGIRIRDLCDSKPWKNSRSRWGFGSFSSGSSRSSQSSNSSNSPSPSSSPSTSTYSSPAPSPRPSPPITPSTSWETLPTCGDYETVPLFDEAQFTDSESEFESDDSDGEDSGFMMNTDGSYHPSKVINDYLLDSADAAFAVTHDNDWCSLEMQKPEDICNPNAILRCLKDTANSNVFSNGHIASLKRLPTQESSIDLDANDIEIAIPNCYRPSPRLCLAPHVSVLDSEKSDPLRLLPDIDVSSSLPMWGPVDLCTEIDLKETKVATKRIHFEEKRDKFPTLRELGFEDGLQKLEAKSEGLRCRLEHTMSLKFRDREIHKMETRNPDRPQMTLRSQMSELHHRGVSLTETVIPDCTNTDCFGATVSAPPVEERSLPVHQEGTIDPRPLPRTILPQHTSRTLVLCFDGTGNQFIADNSNVVKLFSMLKKDDRSKQMIDHQTGIGTYTCPQVVSPFTTKGRKIFDEMSAFDHNAHVMEGYKFLTQKYNQDDRICLFGFSRGAYTNKSLAGMLHQVGLLPDNDQQVPFAYKLCTKTNQQGCDQSNLFKKSFEVKIDFLGVWDTVNSVGLVPKHHPFTTSNTIVATFRHALSLDERRAKFKANLWNRPADYHGSKLSEEDNILSVFAHHYGSRSVDGRTTDVKEVWFSGCHSNVSGGSVRNGTRHSLGIISLPWMIRECFKAQTGVMFETERLPEIGLDPSTLRLYSSVISPRPLPISLLAQRTIERHNLTEHQFRPTMRQKLLNIVRPRPKTRHESTSSQPSSVSTTPSEPLTEEEEELKDSLSHFTTN